MAVDGHTQEYSSRWISLTSFILNTDDENFTQPTHAGLSNGSTIKWSASSCHKFIPLVNHGISAGDGALSSIKGYP